MQNVIDQRIAALKQLEQDQEPVTKALLDKLHLVMDEIDQCGFVLSYGGDYVFKDFIDLKTK